jgi:hypothetical protein
MLLGRMSVAAGKEGATGFLPVSSLQLSCRRRFFLTRSIVSMLLAPDSGCLISNPPRHRHVFRVSLVSRLRPSLLGALGLSPSPSLSDLEDL